jgi:competence protein ComEC
MRAADVFTFKGCKMNRGPIILALVGALALAAFAGYAWYDISKSDNRQPAQAPANYFGSDKAAPLPQTGPPTATPLVSAPAVAQSFHFKAAEPAPEQSPVAVPIVNQPNIPASGETENVTVYVTRTGSKYHSAGCRYLAQSSSPMLLSEASARYGPCSVCNPPPPVSGQTAQAAPQSGTTADGKPLVAENGSRYGEISPATGKPKTTYVRGYTRKDGTQVRGYYRSK